MKIARNRIVSMDGDVFGHFLLSAMSIMVEKQIEIPNPDEYDVTFMVNGVELPVEEVFMAWHDKLDKSAEFRAEELFAEKFQSVESTLSDLAEKIRIEMDAAKVEICNKLDLWVE